jgi:hypothetical protein
LAHSFQDWNDQEPSANTCSATSKGLILLQLMVEKRGVSEQTRVEERNGG